MDLLNNPEKLVDPLSTQTFTDIQKTSELLLWNSIKTRGSRGPDLAFMDLSQTSPLFEFGYDKTDRKPNALGSGQIYDETQDVDYVIWKPAEAEAQAWEANNEIHQVTGYIHHLSKHPTYAANSWDRTYISTSEGRIFLVDAGRYFEDDEVKVREVGEAEAKELLREMQSTAVNLRYLQ